MASGNFRLRRACDCVTSDVSMLLSGSRSGMGRRDRFDVTLGRKRGLDLETDHSYNRN